MWAMAINTIPYYYSSLNKKICNIKFFNFLERLSMEELELYFEQQEGLIYGQHCLNNLLQMPCFSPVDLADIAQELDMLEYQSMTGANGEVTDDTRNYKKEGSGNVDESGIIINIINYYYRHHHHHHASTVVDIITTHVNVIDGSPYWARGVRVGVFQSHEP